MYITTPVYFGNSISPIPFYWDMQLTSTRLNFLKAHTGEFWLCAKFGTGNAFQKYDGTGGLNFGCAAMVYVQRLELRLKLSGDKHSRTTLDRASTRPATRKRTILTP
jgi:hypothetical protein